MKFRTYNQVSGDDRSRLGDQVAAQRRRVRERLADVGRVVAVTSGKGGVGKSFVTASLALGLAERLPKGVGVLDADLGGPTTARLLSATGPLRLEAKGVHPASGLSGVKVFSMEFLLDDESPLRWKEPLRDRFVWRGLLEAGALREFLADVLWGSLDLLLVDLAPGAHRLEDLAELVPNLAGAVAVTIPTEESRRSVQRAMLSAQETDIRLLGVVENMSGYACPSCGATGPLFPGNAGEELAQEFGIPLLARIPFSAPSGEPATAPSTLTAAFLAALP